MLLRIQTNVNAFTLKVADRYNLDKLGISASLLCAIHCALVPLVLPLVSSLGLSFLWSHEFELFMIALAAVVGLWALSHGYRHAHRSLLPFTVFGIGMAIILASKIWINPAYEFLVLPAGAMLIVAAHWRNWKLHQHCDLQHDHTH